MAALSGLDPSPDFPDFPISSQVDFFNPASMEVRRRSSNFLSTHSSFLRSDTFGKYSQILLLGKAKFDIVFTIHICLPTSWREILLLEKAKLDFAPNFEELIY